MFPSYLKERQKGEHSADLTKHAHSAPTQVNPFEKQEAACKSMRDTKRRAKISLKRNVNMYEKNKTSIKFLYGNIRGLSSNDKQSKLRGMIQNEEAIDVVQLTETKLSKCFQMQGWTSMQTAHSRSGGCWCGSSTSNRTKRIKYIGTVITWQSIAFDFVPLHVITVYIEPQNPEKAIKTLSHLRHILSLILDRLPQSRVVVSGDFNEYLPQANKICSARGLDPLIPAGTPTHNRGHHLDQIYSNLKLEGWVAGDTDASDHLFFKFTLSFVRDERDIDIRSMPYEVKPSDIRKQAVAQGTIDKMLSEHYSLQSQAKTLFINDVRKTKKIQQWYYPMKRSPSQAGHHGEDLLPDDFSQTIKEIEEAHHLGQAKRFFDLVNKACKVKKTARVVRGIRLEDSSAVFEPSEINKLIASYIKQQDCDISQNSEAAQKLAALKPAVLNSAALKLAALKPAPPKLAAQNLDTHERNPNVQEPPQGSHQGLNDCADSPMFTLEEVEDAYSQCNVEKGVGHDGFDGRILKMNENLKRKILFEITLMLNEGLLLEYFSEGRLVPLSKISGADIVALDDIRPIIVRSHLSKIAEKAIANKINKEHPYLLKTGSYQAGFKTNNSTHQNIAQIIQNIRSSQQRRTHRKHILFVDLSQAYNSVRRGRIFEILETRCLNHRDAHIVKLLKVLHLKQKIFIGDEEIELINGVAQGSVLSPMLFNVALEEAFKESELLLNMINRGDLLAYADDFLIRSSSLAEIRQAILEIQKLQGEWGLKLNKKKSSILLKIGEVENTAEVEGIPVQSTIKYLGVIISQNTYDIAKSAKSQIKRNMHAIKGKLRRCSLGVKEALLQAFFKSLMIYFCTPLIAGGVWDENDIKPIEHEGYRQIHLLPKDVSRSLITNVAQDGEPITHTIMKLASRVKQKIQKQMILPIGGKSTKPDEKIDQRPRVKIYIPKFIAEGIWAAGRNSSCINYGNWHRCTKHGVKVDLDHICGCDIIDGGDKIKGYIQKLKSQNIRTWEDGERTEALLHFTKLALNIRALINSGQLQPFRLNWFKGTHNPLIDTDHPMPEKTIHKKQRGRPPKIKAQDPAQMKLSIQPHGLALHGPDQDMRL